ncbi:MAG: response regulator [Nitrospirae bacterium]|nr:response regulator [Nitrospirota bacterium]
MTERLLIVEDEDTLCESLKRVFMREGYEVDIASSAEDALSMLEDKSYDVIITDIMLPGMNGIELLKKCRVLNPGQLVLIMTAYDNLWTADEAIGAGAYEYITKPLSHDDIKRIVRNALDGKAPER